MKRPLRIAVADDEQDMRDYYQQILPLLGHEVVAVASSGRQLVEQCLAHSPDLIIADIRMPDMDGIDAALEICRSRPIPVILVSAYHDPSLIDRASEQSILGYLVKPIEQADLEPAIAVAMSRFQQLQTLQTEAGELRQALEDRKVVERAKGILMKRTGLAEADAHRRLQKTARENGQKLAEVARIIITADEAFEPNGEKT